jgi:PAS domain S-box-containing protein
MTRPIDRPSFEDPAHPAGTAGRESERLYADLFDNIDEGFCVLEVIFDGHGTAVDYRFLAVNAAFERQTGLHDPVGKTARELVPDLDEFWFRTYGDVARTGVAIRFENHAPAMDRWFEVYAFRVGAPELHRVGLHFQDVSERVASAARLRDSTAEVRRAEAERDWLARLRQLALDAARLGWWHYDAASGVTTWDERFLEIFGIDPQSPAEAILDNLDPEDRQRVWAAITATLDPADPQPYHLEYRVHRPDGTVRWVEAHGLAIFEGEGEARRPKSFVGTVADITGRKRAEGEQREAQQALEEADRRKDDFLAMLAHELRNPLAPLRNAAEVLRLAGPRDPLVERTRGLIDRQVTHMARLIDDLLDVSRIARGKIQLRRERSDLAEIVRHTAEDLRPTLEAGGLTLALDVPAGSLWVEGDNTRLAQMVGNLLQNAGKFTDPGGRVDLRLAADPATGQARITVADTGIGMEPDLLAHLFEPFSQAEQSLDREKGGLGLGLALVQGLADLHGGTIEAESGGTGQGSTFTLRLPLAAAAAETAGSETPA